jgi:DNA-binding response OmpR family regulator
MKTMQLERPLDEAAVSRQTVLLVEDEELLRLAVAKLLRKNGFFVLEAPNGRAAVDLFRTAHSQIGVVLLDLVLPGLSGAEVLRELQQIRSGVKVILTTAYSPEVVRVFVDGQQAWRFIKKPYRVGDVMELLREALDT